MGTPTLHYETSHLSLVMSDVQSSCSFPLPPKTPRPKSISLLPSSPRIKDSSARLLKRNTYTNGVQTHHSKSRPYSSSEQFARPRSDPAVTELGVLFLTEEIAELKRQLEHERRLRNEDAKNLHAAVHRIYADFDARMVRESLRTAGVEQRVETVFSAYKTCNRDMQAVRDRIEAPLKTISRLWSRVDSLERRTPRHHAHSTSDPQSSRHNSPSPTLIRYAATNSTSSRHHLWHAQIIFILDADRPNVFEVDGVAYLKLQSRRPLQKVFFHDSSPLSFTLGIEGSFAALLASRPWMPFATHRISDSSHRARVALARLPAAERNADLWDRDFLERRCVAHDLAGVPHIYISLRDGHFTWAEIDALPSSVATTAPPRAVDETSSAHLLTSSAGKKDTNAATRVKPTLFTSLSLASSSRATSNEPPPSAQTSLSDIPPDTRNRVSGATAAAWAAGTGGNVTVPATSNGAASGTDAGVGDDMVASAWARPASLMGLHIAELAQTAQRQDGNGAETADADAGAGAAGAGAGARGGKAGIPDGKGGGWIARLARKLSSRRHGHARSASEGGGGGARLRARVVDGC